MHRPTTALSALVLLLPLAGCATAPVNTLTEAETEAGFELLFDGESLEHWRGFKQQFVPDGWVVVDGAIHRAGPAGDLITRETYRDFELLIDWKIGVGGNSGIFFHVTEDHDHVWETGPEFQILDDANHPNGDDPLTRAGSNYALHAPTVDALNTTGAYNRTRIVVQGDRVKHFLNGRLVVQYDLRSPDWRQRVAESKFAQMPAYGLAPEGHIALQDHGDPVWFRNVKIRRL